MVLVCTELRIQHPFILLYEYTAADVYISNNRRAPASTAPPNSSRRNFWNSPGDVRAAVFDPSSDLAWALSLTGPPSCGFQLDCNFDCTQDPRLRSTGSPSAEQPGLRDVASASRLPSSALKVLLKMVRAMRRRRRRISATASGRDTAHIPEPTSSLNTLRVTRA